MDRSENKPVDGESSLNKVSNLNDEQEGQSVSSQNLSTMLIKIEDVEYTIEVLIKEFLLAEPTFVKQFLTKHLVHSKIL